mgnify:CR=1 FL=1
MEEIEEMEYHLEELESKYKEMDEDACKLEEEEWEKKWNPDNNPECPMQALDEEIKQLKQDIENAYDELPYNPRTAGLDPVFSSWEEFYRMVL